MPLPIKTHHRGDTMKHQALNFIAAVTLSLLPLAFAVAELFLAR